MKYYWYKQQASATIIGEGEVNAYRVKIEIGGRQHFEEWSARDFAAKVEFAARQQRGEPHNHEREHLPK